MTDFQETSEAIKPPSFSVITNNTTYRIPPILQLHIKRAWITGLAIDTNSLAQEVHKIDPRVEVSETLRFLSAHISSDDWIKAREESLNKTFTAMVRDSESIRELIDQRYDRHFDKIQTICAEQIDRIASLSVASKDPFSSKQTQTLKNVTAILKETYLLQRLARGMSQGKYIHEVVNENKEFEDALSLLHARLEEKIIDAQARVLPAV